MVERSGIPDDVALGRLEEGHVNDAAAIYLQAFADNVSGKLGPAYARGYLRWFISDPSAIALGMWQNDLFLGFAVGAPLGYQNMLNRDLAGVVARCLAVRPFLLLDREIIRALRGRLLVQLGRVKATASPPKVPAPIMCFVGAGLAAASRGLGIGTRLYGGFTEACQARTDIRSIRGVTHKENVPPGRILEGLGFEPLHEDDHGYVSWYKVLG